MSTTPKGPLETVLFFICFAVAAVVAMMLMAWRKLRAAISKATE